MAISLKREKVGGGMGGGGGAGRANELMFMVIISRTHTYSSFFSFANFLRLNIGKDKIHNGLYA